MNKKKIIGILVVIIIIILIGWLVYKDEEFTLENIQHANKLETHKKEDTNTLNNLLDNEIINDIVENETTNETVNDEKEENKTNNNTSNNTNNENDSETVTDTSVTREEKAVQLAKEYYENEYGSIEDIYFRYDSINGDGRYRVVASSDGKTLAFLLVNLDDGTVTKK